MQATQEGTVVDVTPSKHSLEPVFERELADAHSDLVVAQCVLGPTLEGEVAEMGVRVQTAQVGRQHVHQDLARSRAGFALAYLAVYVLTHSDVARVDGPISVRAAFTPEEALRLAQRAGLDMSVRRCWPRRYNLVWEKP